MADNIQWIFSGVGTELLSLITGVFIGYMIKSVKVARQIQRSGNNSEQGQEMYVGKDSALNGGKKSDYSFLSQSQVAGDNSTQTQVGGINKD